MRFKVVLADVESADAFTEEKQATFKAAVAAAIKVDEAKVECTHELVHGVLTPGDMVRLKSFFDDEEVKKNDEGAIERKEFVKLIKKIMKDEGEKAPPEKDLNAAFVQADEDGGGSVDMAEFVSLYAKVKKGEVKGLGGGSMFSLSRLRNLFATL